MSSFYLSTSDSSRITLCLLGFCFFILTGCPPDESPFQKENQRLLKQTAKQEALIGTLQESNRILQEQIDRLNQELRDVKATFEQQLQEATQLGSGLTIDREKQSTLIETLQKKHLKLSKDAQWLRTQREQFRQALFAKTNEATTAIMLYALLPTTKATRQALTLHEYPLKASMVTDQKAVYVTARKISQPPSLELAGFRNQYVVLLEKISEKQTKVHVQAEFEKVAKHGMIIQAGHAEIREIESHVILEIQKIMTTSAKPKQPTRAALKEGPDKTIDPKAHR